MTRANEEEYNNFLMACSTGSVFLKAPARRVTVAHHDNGASLNHLLASFTYLSTAEMEDQPALVDTNIEYFLETINGEKALDIEHDQMADVLDDGRYLAPFSAFFIFLCYLNVRPNG